MSKIRASHILVKKYQQANNLLNQLKSASEKDRKSLFRQLAKKHSMCPSKKKGGNLGSFGRGQMVKPFEKAAFNLEKGQLSDVVKTKFGYHIIMRTG
ncbi:MAG: peptidylprolyl isomerase [Asgard group archaeon]|nr:peptidylprolyl isomerase [Asgard group archaeon]